MYKMIVQSWLKFLSLYGDNRCRACNSRCWLSTRKCRYAILDILRPWLAYNFCAQVLLDLCGISGRGFRSRIIAWGFSAWVEVAFPELCWPRSCLWPASNYLYICVPEGMLQLGFRIRENQAILACGFYDSSPEEGWQCLPVANLAPGNMQRYIFSIRERDSNWGVAHKGKVRLYLRH